MWTWTLSERDSIRLIWFQLAVPVTALGLAWVVLGFTWASAGFDALVDAVYSQAAYEQTEDGWETDNPEHVIAAYTIWLVVVTGILALFTAFLFIATYALFKTAAQDGEKALTQTRELFIAGRRAWVDATAKGAGFINGEEHGAYQVSVTIRNHGLIPATHVMVRIPKKVEDRLVSTETHVTELLKNLDAARIAPPTVGQTLFPQREHTDTYTITVPAFPATALGVIHDIAGWVEYRFEGSDRAHVTPFVWMLHLTRERGSPEITQHVTDFVHFLAPD